MEEDQACRQEQGVGVEDSRPEEEEAAEHLLKAWEEVQEFQASVGEGDSQNLA